MKNEILWLFEFNRERILQCFDQLAFESIFDIPPFSKKSPIWILGHLTTTYNMCLEWVNQNPVCPESWDTYFSDGTDPSAVTIDIEEIHNIRTLFLTSHDALIPLLKDIDAEYYDGIIKEGHEFPSKRVGILFECMTHDAIHLSELKVLCEYISRKELYA